MKAVKKIRCNICGNLETAHFEAEDKQEMYYLQRDVEENFICSPCFENPENLPGIIVVLGIPKELVPKDLKT